MIDPNRSFPGNPKGNEGEQMVHYIYQDLLDKKPDFVIDSHEARMMVNARDFLGSSLIFTDLSNMGDLFMQMIADSEEGKLFSEPLDYLSPAPKGSLNHTVTTKLNIPTITIETFRAYQMDRRIKDQLDVVNYVLSYFGMMDR